MPMQPLLHCHWATPPQPLKSTAHVRRGMQRLQGGGVHLCAEPLPLPLLPHCPIGKGPRARTGPGRQGHFVVCVCVCVCAWACVGFVHVLARRLSKNLAVISQFTMHAHSLIYGSSQPASQIKAGSPPTAQILCWLLPSLQRHKNNKLM